MFLAVRSAHMQPIASPPTRFPSQDRRRETLWTDPTAEMLRLAPAPENEVARGIEGALDHEHTSRIRGE
jgi:hypothetical protein